MEQTIIRLSPADAGMKISADLFACAQTQAPFIYERWLYDGDYTTVWLPGLKVSLVEVFANM
ncbi:MAG: hypothetical protein IT422_07935 [Pirellulaceae bacterium]|jgi:hypothetical protein|nr:hypothetical protein [Pirellulaceae bacterium]